MLDNSFCRFLLLFNSLWLPILFACHFPLLIDSLYLLISFAFHFPLIINCFFLFSSIWQFIINWFFFLLALVFYFTCRFYIANRLIFFTFFHLSIPFTLQLSVPSKFLKIKKIQYCSFYIVNMLPANCTYAISNGFYFSKRTKKKYSSNLE